MKITPCTPSFTLVLAGAALLFSLAPASAQMPPTLRIIPRSARRGSSSRNRYAPRRGSGRPGGANNRAGANASHGVKHEKGPSEVDLESEVQSLHERHASMVATLPKDLQRLDHVVLPT